MHWFFRLQFHLVTNQRTGILPRTISSHALSFLFYLFNPLYVSCELICLQKISMQLLILCFVVSETMLHLQRNIEKMQTVSNRFTFFQ